MSSISQVQCAALRTTLRADGSAAPHPASAAAAAAAAAVEQDRDSQNHIDGIVLSVMEEKEEKNYQTHLKQTGGRCGSNCCSRLHAWRLGMLAKQPAAWAAVTPRTGTAGRGDGQW